MKEIIMNEKEFEEIKKIFDSPLDKDSEEVIKKTESYGAKYDPDSYFSTEEQLEICEVIDECQKEEQRKERSYVKGNQGSMVSGVSSALSNVIIPTKKKASKDLIAYRIAQELNDLNSLPYYENLVRSRRRDFLRNCLVITLSAFKRGQITKTKAAYFTGVVKGKTALQERIKRYKWKKYTT